MKRIYSVSYTHLDAVLDGSSIVNAPEEVRGKIGFLTSELKLEGFFTPNYLYNFFSDLYGVEPAVRDERKKRLFDRFGITPVSYTHLPNVEGHLKEEEVITYLKKMGLSPIRLKKLEDSRHIFSHIEWHMTGYAVQIDETEQEYQNMLFVDVKETEEQYPIPAAFSRCV